MNTFIAYDKDTFQILGFIKNDYTILEETKEVFKNFENYEVKKTSIDVPAFFSEYKVVLENEEIISFGKMEVQNG